MIHGLRGGQEGNWRQDAKGIRRQHHDVLRMASQTRRDGVVDKRNRIRGARVLGHPIVVQIERPSVGIDRHVLEDRAETPSGGVDLRFGLRRKA